MPTSQLNEIRELAALIEAKRLALGISRNSLAQKFGQLGSSKTFARFLDLADPCDEGLDLAKQLANYQAAWELVQGFTEDPEELKIYADFDFMRDAMATVGEAMQVSDETRLVLITGGSGAGKSSFLSTLQHDKLTANITYRTEATEAWRSQSVELLGSLLTELGAYDRDPTREDKTRPDPEKILPQGSGTRLRKLIDKLDSKRLILAIDEAHHIGPEGYNIIKTIINQTRAIVVMAAIPELIQRINRQSHAEASQLFNNRLFAHIRFGVPNAADTLEFLKRRGVKFTTPREANAIAEKVSNDCATFGLWKYIKRCTREARKQGAGPYDTAAFAKVIVRVKHSISMGA